MLLLPFFDRIKHGPYIANVRRRLTVRLALKLRFCSKQLSCNQQCVLSKDCHKVVPVA